MDIQPIYVTLSQAKVLKGKGFNEECTRFYVKSNSKIFGRDEHGRYYPIKNKPKELYIVGECAVLNIKNKISAPEQWQVVEWLFIYHNIDVLPKINDLRLDKQHKRYICCIYYKGKELIVPEQDKTTDRMYMHFRTKQEAYSAAFDYILKELI
jgi:hypothetical protein